MGRTIVHIQVGDNLQDFGVHKDLLCGHSPYFKAAFTSGFEETTTGIMKFPDLEVDVFDIFYNWLYRQQLFDENTDESEWPDTDDLLKLYVFADMARITILKNQIIDAVQSISTHTKGLPTSMFPHVWDNTTPTDPMRNLIVDWLVWDIHESEFEENPDDYPAGLRLEVMTAMRKLIGTFQNIAKIKRVNPLQDMSKYHQEEDMPAEPSSPLPIISEIL